MKLSGGGSDGDGSDGISDDNFEKWVKNKVGLKGGVVSKHDYIIAYRQGIEEARSLFHSESPPVVTPAVIKSVHYEIFKNIHFEADQTRGPGQENIFICGKRGVLPEHIPQALTELQQSAEIAFSQPALFDQATAIACHYLRLKEIQPFMDGNGRTAGVIMEGHVRSCLLKDAPEVQQSFSLSMDADVYYGALGEGIVHHNPTKMIEAVIAAAGVTDKILAQEGQTVSELLKSDRWKETARLFLAPLKEHAQAEHGVLMDVKPVVVARSAQGLKEHIVAEHIPQLAEKLKEASSTLQKEPEASHKKPELERRLEALNLELNRAIATASWCEMQGGKSVEVLLPAQSLQIDVKPTPVPRGAKEQLEVAQIMSSVMKLPEKEREALIHGKSAFKPLEIHSKQDSATHAAGQTGSSEKKVEAPLPLRIATETTVRGAVLEQLSDKDFKAWLFNPAVKTINFIPASELKNIYEAEKAFAQKELPHAAKERMALTAVKDHLREETKRSERTEKRLSSSQKLPKAKEPVKKSNDQDVGSRGRSQDP